MSSAPSKRESVAPTPYRNFLGEKEEKNGKTE